MKENHKEKKSVLNNKNKKNEVKLMTKCVVVMFHYQHRLFND